jgi:O-antigen ligase
MSKQKIEARKARKAGKAKPQPKNDLIFYLFAGFFIFFIPLFRYNPAMDITLMPRTLAVSIFLLGFSILLFHKKQFPRFDFRVIRSPIITITILYLLITIASVFWAINHRESFFDMVRTNLFLLVLAYAAVIFNTVPEWQNRIPKMVIFAAITAFLIGIVQYYNKVFLTGNVNLEDGREAIYAVIGIMSHKNEFSNQLMMMLPFLGYGIYALRGGWRTASVITTLMLLVLILILKTRAVWVGIALGGFVACVFMVISAPRINLHRYGRIALGSVLIIGIAGAIYIRAIPERPDDFSLLGRLKNITNTSSSHNIHRINVWKATLDMIEEKPFHGVGAGNWQMLIAPYTKGMFTSMSALNWGRPHNDYLWVWAEKGIFGLILFLTIFGLAFLMLFQVFFRSPHVNDRVLALMIIAGILGYISISFFAFPYERINHTAYLALFLAAAIALRNRYKPWKPLTPNRNILLTIAIATTTLSIIYGYNSVKMEIHMKETIRLENAGQYEAAIQSAQQAMNPFRSLNPMAYPPEYYVAKNDFEIGKKLKAQGMEEAAIQRFEQALMGYDRTLELFPDNVWAVSRKGLVYTELEQHEKVIECLDHLLEIIPTLKRERLAKASAFYKMGEYQKAIDTFKEVPDWEKDKTIVQNIQALENLIANEE